MTTAPAKRDPEKKRAAPKSDAVARFEEKLVDHPLLPYIFKANEDLRGEQTPYTPIPEVWQNEFLSEDVNEFLLDYLKLVEIQVNRVDKLVDSAQDYCDQMIETFPESQHITKKETAKIGEKRKKRSQPHVNVASNNNHQWVPSFNPFFPSPEALMQAQFFQTPFLNPGLYQNYSHLIPDQSSTPSDQFGMNVQNDKSMDVINKDIAKTTD